MIEHPIRPGLSLHWGPGRRDATVIALHASDAVFIFSLVDAKTEAASSQMALVQGGALANPEPAHPPPAFEVAVVVSARVLQELLAEDKTPGATRVRQHARSDDTLRLPLTPGARLAVESIRRCPFVGAIRTMALAARCNDLLFEFFTALAALESPRVPTLARNASDRIHAAAEILKLDFEEPPTLAALARRVGLSETTLKRGFRQVFGTTVFGYLRARRMERAHVLLQSGEATVLEAATRVGYSNPSNFSAAFRRQFGVNPKAFQLTARR